MHAVSLNNRFIVEAYKEDRSLKTSVSNGFAMVSQKISLKGLKILVDAEVVTGSTVQSYPAGYVAYIKEGALQSAPWAKAFYTTDAVEGEFMIVEAMHVEFVVAPSL